MSAAPAWPAFSAAEEPMDVLVKLSRFYGGDERFVVAGGGNTSYKTADRLFVKASGSALATMTREGFAEMDRAQLDALVVADLGSEPNAREEQFKQAALAARVHPEKGQRPSIETLLHHLYPGTFVVHTHATIANTLTSCTGGQTLARELFGDEVVWLPYVDPGFKLAQELRIGLRDFRGRTGREAPTAVLMGNHGIIVGGQDPAEIRQRTAFVLDRVSARLSKTWSVDGFGRVTRVAVGGAVVEALKEVLAAGDGQRARTVVFDGSELALSLAGGERGRQAAEQGPLNPDQIVYCTSFPLWFEPRAGEQPVALAARLTAELAAHKATRGFTPKVVILAGAGIFFVGDDAAGAQTVRSMYLDAILVMSGAARLGGISYLNAAQRGFIENWEAEAYRKQIAAQAQKKA